MEQDQEYSKSTQRMRGVWERATPSYFFLRSPITLLFLLP